MSSTVDSQNNNNNFINLIVHDYLLDKLTKDNVEIPIEKLKNKINNVRGPQELYHCIYDLEPRPEKYSGYRGLAKLAFDMFVIDFDVKDDSEERGANGEKIKLTQDQIWGKLSEVWEQTKSFCKRLDESSVPYQLYFSGNKGFHVKVHKIAAGLPNDPQDSIALKNHVLGVLSNLQKTYPAVDTAVSNVPRLIRSHNSFNKKSKKYKIRLTDAGFESPLELSLDTIYKVADHQQNLPFLPPKAPSTPCDWLSEYEKTKTYTSRPQNTQESRAGGDDGFASISDYVLHGITNSKKKCIDKILRQGVVLPGIHKNDLEVISIYDLLNTGVPYNVAVNKLRWWGKTVFTAAEDFDRVEKLIKRFDKEYAVMQQTGEIKYPFSCYDKTKKAYCDAKCPIYKGLDPARRAHLPDVTDRIRRENMLARLTEDELARVEVTKLSESEIAEAILNKIGASKDCLEPGSSNIIKLSNGSNNPNHMSFYKWNGMFWKEVPSEKIKQKFQSEFEIQFQNKYDENEIRGVESVFFRKIKDAPRHLINVRFDVHNFLNGTVHISKDINGKIQLTLKPHSKEDYLTYVKPLEFDDSENFITKNSTLPRTGVFKKYINESVKNASDDDAPRFIRQMLATCLIPFESKIFFLIGKTGSGKSTLASLASMMLGGKTNCSSVSPMITKYSSNPFSWENAVGKIANICAELPDAGHGMALDTNTLKKIRDKEPVQIDRKFKSVADVILPTIHIYCANKMPSSNEGGSGALGHRFLVLEYKKDSALPIELESRRLTTNMAKDLWDIDAGGVVDMALEGLRDLVASGFVYFVPESSKKFVENWETEGNNVKLFFEELAFVEGLFEKIVEKKGDGSKLMLSVLAKELFKEYKTWCVENGYRHWQNRTFYKNAKLLGCVMGKKTKKGPLINIPGEFFGEAESRF